FPGFLDIVYEPDRQGGEAFRLALPRIVAFLRSRLRDDSPRSGARPDRYEGLDDGRFFGEAAPRTETDVAFLEGPTVDRDGLVYFSDIRAERIYTWSLGNRRLSVFRERGNGANGLILDRQGRLLACERDRVTRTDPATGRVEVLADQFGGKPLGAPNDLDL